MIRKRAPGGGRKPLTATEPTVKVAITLLASQVEAMNQLGNGNLSAGIRKAIENMTSNFGTVTHEGKKYTLTQEADFSNRQFVGSWFDAQEGEEYTAEFSARALDAEGNEHWVYWQFDTVKGNECPLDSYPWSDAHISQVVPQ